MKYKLTARAGQRAGYVAVPLLQLSPPSLQPAGAQLLADGPVLALGVRLAQVDAGARRGHGHRAGGQVAADQHRVVGVEALCEKK